MHRSPAPLTLLVATLLSLSACATPSEEGELTETKRDFLTFRSDVYPVLIRDCGFPTCHGAPERLFRVFGPGRARLLKGDGTEPTAFEDPTGDEITTSYALAQAMIDPLDPARSLLLRKPLAAGAGGAGHEGVDRYGRDVYRTRNDEGFRALEAWVMAVPEPAPAAMDNAGTGGNMAGGMQTP